MQQAFYCTYFQLIDVCLCDLFARDEQRREANDVLSQLEHKQNKADESDASEDQHTTCLLCRQRRAILDALRRTTPQHRRWFATTPLTPTHVYTLTTSLNRYLQHTHNIPLCQTLGRAPWLTACRGHLIHANTRPIWCLHCLYIVIAAT